MQQPPEIVTELVDTSSISSDSGDYEPKITGRTHSSYKDMFRAVVATEPEERQRRPVQLVRKTPAYPTESLGRGARENYRSQASFKSN